MTVLHQVRNDPERGARWAGERDWCALSRGIASTSDPMIVYCAGVSWDGNRGTDQHLASHLTRHARVIYVDPPVSVVSRHGGWKADPSALRSKLSQEADGLWRLAPVSLPLKTREPMVRVTSLLIRRQLAAAVKKLDGDVDAVIAATLWPVFGVCGERVRVFFATDDFQAGASLMGLSPKVVRRQETEALSAADVVVTVSDHLNRTLRSRSRVEPVTIENGVDVAAFRSVDAAAMPTDVTLEPPVAGLVGHISDRIDLDILEAVAESGVSLLLVGLISHTYRSARFESLLRRDNVQWVGPKPFEALASYMRVIDVGLLPYGDTSFNRASFPLKVLEYLAAGRPVVATDLPAVRSLGPVVRPAQSPAEFAREVERALAEAPDASATDQRRSVAEEHSWDRVTLRFLQAVGLHDEA